MRILSGILASFIASGVLFAADFSKSSDADLINLAGKVQPSDAKDYFAEIDKRIDEMTTKEARDFREKMRLNEEKVFDNMKVKDVRAYRKSIDEALGRKFPHHAKMGDKRDFEKGQRFKGGKCSGDCSKNAPSKKGDTSKK